MHWQTDWRVGSFDSGSHGSFVGFMIRYREEGAGESTKWTNKTIDVARGNAPNNATVGEMNEQSGGRANEMASWQTEVGELQTATGYSFMVRVLTEMTAGAWSQVLLLQTASTTPSAPLAVDAIATGPSSLSVRWSPPANDGGSPVTKYKIYFRQITATPWVSAFSQGESTVTSLANLVADTEYEVKLAAINANGLGPDTDQSVVVKTLENDVPVLPPSAVSASFTSLAQGIEIVFDSESDRGEAGGMSLASTDCQGLVSFPGSSPADACSWVSKSKLMLIFGGGSSVLPGDSITIHEGKLRAECTVTSDCLDWEYNQAQSLTISAPADALTPTVLLTGPSIVGVCDNVTINSGSSTGSGGREFAGYVWTVMGNDDAPLPSDHPISTQVASATSGNLKQLFLASSWLEAGASLKVKLELTNFLGLTESAVFTLSKLSVPVPTVEIDGGSQQSALRSVGLSLSAVASAPSCVALDSMRVTYSWFINSQSLAEDNVALAPTALRLPALSKHLLVGQTSVITVVVNDTNGGSNTATTFVTVRGSPLIPVIGGGSRSVGFDHDFTLDASGSLDPDNETATTQYSWSCSPVGSMAPNCGADAVTIAQTASEGLGSAVLNMPGGTLAAESHFLWEVRVVKGSRVASTSVTLTIVAGNPVQIGIDGSCCTTKVNPSQRIVIQSIVSTGSSAVSASTAWSQSAGDLDFSAFGFYPNVVLTPIVNSAALVIRAGSLTPGGRYTFHLTGTAPGRASGSATITLVANAAPTSGSLALTPPEGTVLETKFAFEASQWVDEDLPLQYRFGYIDPAASTDKFIGTQQFSPLTSGVLLPQGIGPNSALLTFAIVLDSLGALVKASKSITVRELVINTAELTDKTHELLSSALDTQDSAGVFQAIGAIGVMINVETPLGVTIDQCASAPDCTALQREACVGNGKCGPCTTGLVASVGKSANNTDACTSPLPACANSQLDDTETDVDCGGDGVCPGCTAGLNCQTSSDCSGALVCAVGSGLGLLCAQPLKKCPMYGSSVCSAMGSCQHVSSAGVVIDPSSFRCTSDHADCEAVCDCNEGRYGIGCQMDEDSYQQMVSLRETMLAALASTEATTEKSPDDLAQQASFVNLLTAVPSELSPISQDAVLGMMGRLVSSSSKGGIVEGMDGDVASALGALLDTDFLSRHSTNATAAPARRRRRRLGDTSNGAGGAIGQTLYELSQASLVDAVNGEAAKSVNTKNIALSFQKVSSADVGAVGLSAGAFEVPAGALSISGASSVNSQSTSFTKTPHVGDTPAGFSGLQSRVVGLTLSDATGEIEVKNLSTPIMLVVPNSMPIDYGEDEVIATFNHTCKAGVAEELTWECPGGNSTVSVKCELPWWSTVRESVQSRSCLVTTEAACTYWDEDTGSWSNEGCTVVSFTAENTTCACTHLTDFGAASKAITAEAMAVLSQDPRDIFDPATMLKNIVVFATVFTIFGVCLCLIFFGWKKDLADTKALIPELNSGKEHDHISAAEKGALLKGGIVSGIEGEPDYTNAPAASQSSSTRRLAGAGLIAVVSVRGKARKRLHEADSKLKQLEMRKLEMKPLDKKDQKWLNKKTRWVEKKRKRFDEEDKRTQKRMSDGIPLVYLITSTWALLKRVMKEKHKLLAVWWVFLPSFTRPQRLILIWVSIMGIMTANAILYDLKNPEVDCAAFSTDWDLHIRGNASDCSGQMDLLENPMCTWDADPEKEECLDREQPLGEQLAAAIVVGIISALVVAPVDVVLIVSFKKVAPSKKVRAVMQQFDDEINSRMTTDLTSKEQNKDAPTDTPPTDVEGQGGQSESPKRLCDVLGPQPEKTEGSESQVGKVGRRTSIILAIHQTKRKMSKAIHSAVLSMEQQAQMRREQDPLDEINISKAALKLIAKDDERYRQAGRRLPYMVRKQKKASKNAKVYAVSKESSAKESSATEGGGEEGGGEDGECEDGEWELQALRPAPPLWKRCIMCRRKRTRGEKRWEWAVAKVTQQRKMEIELRKLTDTQRAARLLEIARVSKMPGMVKTAYNLNKLPLQPIGKPLPYSFQYIAYFIGFGYVFLCGYFLLGFGVRRGADVTNAWLVSMLTSLVETMIISWPTTIFFMNVLLPRVIQPLVSKIDISEAKDTVAQHAGNLVSG
jgi:hypothetical protein